MATNGGNGRGPRCIALVGPFQSGKTTLLEAILARTNTIQRQGTVDAGTTVGDASKEARHHKMSVEVTVATASFMGDDYTFIDCPGSVEFVHEMRAVLPAIDAAIVVCEADERKVSQLQLVMRELEDRQIPRFLFLNKIDKADQRVRETLKLLQPASRVPLLLRQIPIWKNEIITGFVDLALERAFVYKEHVPSEVIPLEGDDLSREKDARFSMLETLADHDDELMEQLLDDIPPPRDKVFDDLAKEQRDGLICPVLIGVATRTNGVLRLLKALRHESRGIEATAKRLGIKGNDPVAYVLKTFHTAHGGKMSVARVLSGQVGDGTTLSSPTEDAGRVSGVLKLVGQVTEKRGPASAGETVALGKLDHARTGDTLSAGKQAHKAVAEVAPYPPVLAIAISAKDRKDDVKLGVAFNKLLDEDPSLVVHHNPETHEVVVWGQGEMHLRVATERLADRYGIAIDRAYAARRLPRDHPQADQRAARPAQEAVGRPRPVRRRGARHQAAAARLGLRVRGEDRRRRGAAQLHPVGRGGRGRCVEARAARLPGSRSLGVAGGWLLPRSRQLGHGVPHRRPHRHQRRAAAVQSGAARADPHGRDRLPVGGDRQDQRHPVGPPRPDPELRHARRLVGLGHGAGDDAGVGDRRPHHRGALGDGRRRQLHVQVRPHGRIDRQAGRPDRRGAAGRGGGVSRAGRAPTIIR